MILLPEAIKNIKYKCPVCNSVWKEDSSVRKEMWDEDHKKFKNAYSFDTCFRRCDKDNIAISNGKKPKIIFKSIEKNVPDELLSCGDKLSELLENCLNRKHKKSKKDQFCFYRSEDAFTWAYFGYICKNGLLKELQNAMNLSSPVTNILFWGTPYFSNSGENLKEKLIQACDECNENKSSRSEPDIIICTETELIFIEVKVDSNNPHLGKSQNEKAMKYKKDSFYNDFDKACNLYELTRNWSLGNLLTQNTGKSFRLVNLMPESHVKEEQESEFQKNFIKGLKNPENYELMSWEKLFQCVDEDYGKYLYDRMNNILAMK